MGFTSCLFGGAKIALYGSYGTDLGEGVTVALENKIGCLQPVHFLMKRVQ